MSADGEIIVPGSPRWPDFLTELGRVHRCRGTTEHARAVLSRMSGADVEISLREMARLGATCDCMIELDLSSLVPSLSA